MLDEARKREKVANAVLGLAFAAGAAQSPKDFVRTGSIESPGVAIMQRTIGNPRKQRKNLDSGLVVPRNKKMKKTLKEFLGEAYLYEMRKEDKVAGKKKTPLNLTVTTKHVRKDEDGNWKVKKLDTQRPNPEAQMGRFKQGRGMPGDSVHHSYNTEGGTGRGP